MVLRLLILKHVRNWSYEVLEREVRANLVYRDFTRVGGGKMPDAKTMGRWGLVVGPQVIKRVHQQLVAIAQAEGIAAGRRMRVDTTVVETNIHDPTDSSLLGDGVRVLTRVMKKITAIAGEAGARLRDRSRSVKLRMLEIARAARAKGPQSQKRLKHGYGRLLDSTSRVVGQAKRFAREIADGVKRAGDVVAQLALEGLRQQLVMFLRAKIRRKDGKEHRTFSIVENRRVRGGRVVQRHVLYLGEINDSQELAWRKSIEAIEERAPRARTLSLFPDDRCEGLIDDGSIVRLKLKEMRLCRPRTFGSCWLALTLWRELQLDRFWKDRLPASREGTRWDEVLFVLVAYRLLSPGSEWRLHREWFDRSALADLLGSDASLGEINTLYRCHDRLLAHKQAVFDHLTGRWRDLFNASFEVLLYDLTSTYFEADPPFPEGDKRRHGYSRDHRPDCVQVVIALIITPDGLPLAYEVLPGNTSDKTTLKGFLERIEAQYGKAERVWLMDRGVPTEEILSQM